MFDKLQEMLGLTHPDREDDVTDDVAGQDGGAECLSGAEARAFGTAERGGATPHPLRERRGRPLGTDASTG